MPKRVLVAILLLALAGCETVRDVDGAYYEKIQPEVEAYYRCGEAKSYGMATTALRPRDIATAAKGACERRRHRVITLIQKRYDSAIWSRLTIDIDRSFANRAIAQVIWRRQDIRKGQVSY